MDELILQNQQQYERVCEKMKKLLIKKQQIYQEEPKQILEGLVLANYSYAVNKKYLVDHGITLVVTCLKIDDRDRCKGVQYREVLLKDQPDQNIKRYFDEVFDLIASHLAAEGQPRCLLSWQSLRQLSFSAKSRSPSLAVAFVMKKNKLGFEDAFDYIRQKSPKIFPNSGFIEQLKQYGKDLEAIGKQIQIKSKRKEQRQQNQISSAQNLDPVASEKIEQGLKGLELQQKVIPQEQQQSEIQTPPQIVEDQSIEHKQLEPSLQIPKQVQSKNTEEREEMENSITSQNFADTRTANQENQGGDVKIEGKNTNGNKQESAKERCNMLQQSEFKEDLQQEQAQILEEPTQQQPGTQSQMRNQALIEVESQNSPEEKTLTQETEKQEKLDRVEESSPVQAPVQNEQVKADKKLKQQQSSNPHDQGGYEEGQIRKRKKKNKKKK